MATPAYNFLIKDIKGVEKPFGELAKGKVCVHVHGPGKLRAFLAFSRGSPGQRRKPYGGFSVAATRMLSYPSYAHLTAGCPCCECGLRLRLYPSVHGPAGGV